MEKHLTEKYLEDLRLVATFPDLCEVRPGLPYIKSGNSAVILDLLDEIKRLRKDKNASNSTNRAKPIYS